MIDAVSEVLRRNPASALSLVPLLTSHGYFGYFPIGFQAAIGRLKDTSPGKLPVYTSFTMEGSYTVPVPITEVEQ